MKRVLIWPAIITLGLSLSACGSNTQDSNSGQATAQTEKLPKTELKFLGVHDSEMQADSKGKATINIQAPKDAKIVAKYDTKINGSWKLNLKYSKDKYTGSFTMNPKIDGVIVTVTAKSAGHRTNSKDILVDNNPDLVSDYRAQRASEKKAESIKESEADKQAEADLDSISQANSAADASSEAKESAAYPDVNTALPNGILNYSTSTLIQTQFKLTGTVTDLGADGMKNYHILITGDGDSKPEYLLVIPGKKTGKVTLDDDITVWGGASGVSKLNQTQVNVGISPSYKNTKVALLMADKVEIN